MALRDELWHRLGPFIVPFPGWAAGNALPPCTWAYVGCDAEGHITSMCALVLLLAGARARREAACAPGCWRLELRAARPCTGRPCHPPLRCTSPTPDSRLWNGDRGARARALAHPSRWSQQNPELSAKLAGSARLPAALAKLRHLQVCGHVCVRPAPLQHSAVTAALHARQAQRAAHA